MDIDNNTFFSIENLYFHVRESENYHSSIENGYFYLISVGIKIGRRLDHKILVAAFTIVQTAPDHASINAAYIAHDLVISVNATFVCV